MNIEPDTHRIGELGAADFDTVIENGVTLVDFWAPWCGPCHMQTPVLQQLAGRFGGRARIAKVNVDDHPELANRFQITGIPTLLLFKQGQPIRQFVGVQPAPVLIAALESVI
ncbi:MAG: thioredoxin [Verrucomicrobia bacterium]|nr:thioredoxin [Verrucomicrobiota bacterium]